jgi:hypothetical protein
MNAPGRRGIRLTAGLELTSPGSGNPSSAATAKRRGRGTGFPQAKGSHLGDITSARGTEAYLPLRLRLWGALGTADFNIRVVR